MNSSTTATSNPHAFLAGASLAGAQGFAIAFAAMGLFTAHPDPQHHRPEPAAGVRDHSLWLGGRAWGCLSRFDHAVEIAYPPVCPERRPRMRWWLSGNHLVPDLTCRAGTVQPAPPSKRMRFCSMPLSAGCSVCFWELPFGISKRWRSSSWPGHWALVSAI